MDSLEFAKKWDSIHKKCNPEDKLFLEILTYAFIGVKSHGSGIRIKKNKINIIENNKRCDEIVYTITVSGE